MPGRETWSDPWGEGSRAWWIICPRTRHARIEHRSGYPYSEAAPFSIKRVRDLAESVNDAAKPVVTESYGWKPWVNGGALLTIDGQCVDFLHRNLDQIERIIAQAEAGWYEIHYLQPPPFGFFSGTYLCETRVCIPLLNPRESRRCAQTKSGGLPRGALPRATKASGRLAFVQQALGQR